MRFNLEQLEVFIAAVECGSFSAAARHFGKAQSAVSNAIANLELDLNVTLFDRSRREPVVTAEGRVLLEQARALLEQAKRFQGHADVMSEGEEGSLSLAIEESLIGPELEDLFIQFEQQFPQLELEFLNPARMDIIELVASGRADIGLLITTFTRPKSYRLRSLGEMAMISVVARDHPLAGSGVLRFDDLVPHRQLVLTSRGGEMYPSEQVSSHVWRIESLFGLLELAKRGLGWGWVPEHLALPTIRSGELVMLKFEAEADRCHLPVDMISSSIYREGRAGQWLFQALSELSFLKTVA